jgi:integrase
MSTNSKMPAKQNGLVWRKDSTIAWFEIRAPKDLAHIYPGRYAHRVSLGTRDPREAKVKAAQLWAEWQARFEQQRRKPLAFEKVSEITPEMATLLAETIIRESLDADERLRIDPREQAGLLHWMQLAGKGEPKPHPQGGMPDELADMMDGMNREHDEESGTALARGRVDSVLPALQYAGQKLGIIFDRETPGVDAALAAALKARKAATAAKVQRDLGHIVETPPPALKSPPGKTRKLRDVFDEWRKSIGVTRDAGTVRAKELALEDYEAFPGATALNAITREHGNQFKAWILAREGLAPKTQHQRLTDVKTLLKHAAQELEWIPKSPWVGIDIEHGVTTPRKPWTPAQLSALFALPLFAAYTLPRLAKAGADAGYWIPLLALFTGARMGELCQLQPTDIREEDGLWGIDINDDKGKSVKTSASVRWVPTQRT